MADKRTCSVCGGELPGDAPAGLCVACLLKVGLPDGKTVKESGPGNTIALDLPLTERAGDRIGHYKLLQQIGEGGCGVVYMAEQQEPVKRRVALKVIKLGMDTKQVIARFEAERQALALMDHPNIAKVLDAGATETGRPYFVMELVRGQRITEYCDENSLDTEARLGLFMQVCHAIQHAHQKGIIHRDINFGERLRRQSNYAEAEPMFREALAMRRKLDGDENPSLASPLFHLGLVLQEQGKLSEAEAQFREALAKQPLGNDYPFASTLLSGLAKVLRAQGKPDQVEGMYHEWLRNLRSRASVSELQIGAVLAEVTLKLLNEKKFAEAGQFDKAVAVQKEAIALLQDERSRQDYASRLKLYESNKPCRVSG